MRSQLQYIFYKTIKTSVDQYDNEKRRKESSYEIHIPLHPYRVLPTTAALGIAVATIFATPAGAAVTYLIDFSGGPNSDEPGTATSSPDANGNYWNNPVDSADLGVGANDISALVDTENTISSIGFTSNSNLGQNDGGPTATASTLGLLDISSATDDYWFSITTLSFTFLGSIPTTYDIRVFGSRETTTTRITQYQVTAATGSHHTATSDLARVARASEWKRRDSTGMTAK